MLELKADYPVSIHDLVYSYDKATERNYGILTEEQQEKIRQTRVGIAGLASHIDTLLTLLQMGFRRFKIADGDCFSTTDMNRQVGCRGDNLGEPRGASIAEDLSGIAPDVEIEVFTEELAPHNAPIFVKDIDVLIDGLPLQLMTERKFLFDAAMFDDIPVFTSPVIGYGAGLAVFHPKRSPRFTDFFGWIPEEEIDEWETFLLEYKLNFMGWKPMGVDLLLAEKQRTKGKPPVIAAGCRVRAGLVTSAIIGWLFHRQMVPVVPTTTFVDLLGLRIIEMGALKRWLMKALIRRVLENSKLGRLIHIVLDWLSVRHT